MCSLAAKRTRVARTIEQHTHALRQSRHEFDHARGWAEDIADQQRRVCMLDVGGEVFHCDRNVFLDRRNSPDNFLSVLTSGALAVSDQDDNGPYFVDRDPATFVHILNFMRGNDAELLARPLATENALTCEAVFFGLHGLSATPSSGKRVCVVTRLSIHVYDPTKQRQATQPWVTYQITTPQDHDEPWYSHYYCGGDGRLWGVATTAPHGGGHLYCDTLYPISRVWVRQSIPPSPATTRCDDNGITTITDPAGQFLVNVDFDFDNPWATVSVLDRDEKRGEAWRRLPRIATDENDTPRQAHTTRACVVNGILLLFWVTLTRDPPRIQSYNLNAGDGDGSVRDARQMRYPRWCACVVACRGAMLVIGGRAFGNPRVTTGVVEAYDPVSDTWSTLPRLNHPRLLAQAAVHDDGNGNVYVYVCGGWYGNERFLDEIERIRLGVDADWEVLPSPICDPVVPMSGRIAPNGPCTTGFRVVSVACFPDTVLSR